MAPNVGHRFSNEDSGSKFRYVVFFIADISATTINLCSIFTIDMDVGKSHGFSSSDIKKYFCKNVSFYIYIRGSFQRLIFRWL